MSAFAKIALVAITMSLVLCQRSNADLMLLTIHAPKDCPEGLTIKSNARDGMIEFDVTVDAEEVANADELYKGRVRANAFLSIATAEQKIAVVNLYGATEGQRTRYQFRISPSAVKTSELQLGVWLYEKDGSPTFGGGVSMQVHLAGFEPTMEKTDEAKAKP